MKKILLLIIMFLLIGFAYADSNGVWHNSADVKSGVFGSDEGAGGYSFVSPVAFNNPILVTTVTDVSNSAFYFNLAGNSVLNTLSVRGQDTDARYQKDINGSCSVGSVVSGVNDDGTVVCSAESDPTVLASVKDGIVWTEVGGIPDDFLDGVDDGLLVENDPTVLNSVKDGVSWGEVTAKPAFLDDNKVSWTEIINIPVILNDNSISWTEVTNKPAILNDNSISWTEIINMPTILNDNSISWTEVIGKPTVVSTETDPTVPASIKDGISWSEVSGKPTIVSTESDPTVPAYLKDGVSWSEISGKPAGFLDGVDDTGSISCDWDGSRVTGATSGSCGSHCVATTVYTTTCSGSKITSVTSSYSEYNEGH